MPLLFIKLVRNKLTNTVKALFYRIIIIYSQLCKLIINVQLIEC